MTNAEKAYAHAQEMGKVKTTTHLAWANHQTKMRKRASLLFWFTMAALGTLVILSIFGL